MRKKLSTTVSGLVVKLLYFFVPNLGFFESLGQLVSSWLQRRS